MGAQTVEKPLPSSGRLQEVFLEDFKRELAEIKSPAAKALFSLIKANHLMHLRISEYMALIAMADITDHFGVGVLLERCLADKLDFVERTRHLIRHSIELKHDIKLAAPKNDQAKNSVRLNPSIHDLRGELASSLGLAAVSRSGTCYVS